MGSTELAQFLRDLAEQTDPSTSFINSGRLSRMTCETEYGGKGCIREHAADTVEENPERDRRQRSYLFISRYLERVGDHATNIANDVIYMQEGEIVRHREALEGAEPAPGVQ